MSHVSMCVFKLSDGSLGNNTLWLPAGPRLSGVPRSVSGAPAVPAAPRPTPGVSFVCWDPIALGTSPCCHGGLEKPLLGRGFAVTALQRPAFQGGPMGPAAALANPAICAKLQQPRAAWAPEGSPRPQQLPLCALPSHFCTPGSRGPKAEDPATPREKPCRAETSP